MSCLRDAGIQAVVDNEAGRRELAHLQVCDACASRVREQRRRIEAFKASLAEWQPPLSMTEGRLRQTLESGGASRGATTLRADRPFGPGWRRAGWGAGLAAAAASVLIFVLLLPLVSGRTTVSAAEILARSLDRLSASATSGVEFLEYELALHGIPREFMPDTGNGIYSITEVIDHDRPGRYRISVFGPNGTLVAAVSEDPVARQRQSRVTVDGQSYMFDFTLASDVKLSLLEVERLHLQASVAMMQASSDQKLSEVNDSSGHYYVIQIPRVSAGTETALWDLHEARVHISATDFRIKEFAARGTLFNQPYSMSYKLTRRDVRPSSDVTLAEFQIAPDPQTIVLKGEGTANLSRDTMMAALRALRKAAAGEM